MTEQELKLVVDVVFAWVEAKESGLALQLTKALQNSIDANLGAILVLVNQKKQP